MMHSSLSLDKTGWTAAWSLDLCSHFSCAACPRVAPISNRSFDWRFVHLQSRHLCFEAPSDYWWSLVEGTWDGCVGYGLPVCWRCCSSWHLLTGFGRESIPDWVLGSMTDYGNHSTRSCRWTVVKSWPDCVGFEFDVVLCLIVYQLEKSTIASLLCLRRVCCLLP